MKNKPVARLAFRHEGDFWNAYVAEMDTMSDAVLIGSIVMAAVVDNKDISEAFKQLMQNVFKEFLREYYGASIKRFTEQQAPEHEKAGHA